MLTHAKVTRVEGQNTDIDIAETRFSKVPVMLLALNHILKPKSTLGKVVQFILSISPISLVETRS